MVQVNAGTESMEKKSLFLDTTHFGLAQYFDVLFVPLPWRNLLLILANVAGRAFVNDNFLKFPQI